MAAVATSLITGSATESKEPRFHPYINEKKLNEENSLTTVAEKKSRKPRFEVARVDFHATNVECNDDSKHADCKQDSPTSPNHVGNHGIHSDDKCPDSPGVLFPLDTYNRTHSYDTHNLKTFGKNTIEALPHEDHYRNILSATGEQRLRPTLAQLHDDNDGDIGKRSRHKDLLIPDVEKGQPFPEGSTEKKTGQGPKFGWIQGVLIRCLLNIWGVMLFMRLSWVVGQAGIGLATIIILLSAVVTTITALSMSAICTNGQVKGGGAYYMISRSLGPEFGGAIGLVFSVANAVAVAMYVVGFAETVRDILKANNALMVDATNDIRIIGVITIILLLGIAMTGMEWEARAQVFLLGILVVAMLNFVVGTFIPPSEGKRLKGFVGYRGDLFVNNIGPYFRDGEDFFSVFAVFFPAATGILAGANISGDLKDAQDSIPKGSLLSILISSIVYVLAAWMVGLCVVRDATGAILSDTLTSSSPAVITANPSVYSAAPVLATPHNMNSIQNCSRMIDNQCHYGLMNDFQVMELASGFGPLITAGIFSATLSSALASLVSAPKVFQAVCKDKIFPGIHVFAKGNGPADNPRRAFLLAFIIGIAFICIGELNSIAPIISNFFLMAYALINYSCFDASLARSPGWRPAFKYYSKWSSLFGALLCLIVMFVINWWTALITFGVVATLYIYVHYTKPDVNWGSSTQAHVYRNALSSSLKLVNVLDHIKNFRPQVLVLTGRPQSRPALVDIVSSITKDGSLLVCGHLLLGPQESNLKYLKTSQINSVYSWFHRRKIKSFYSVATAPTFPLGVQTLMQSVGVGKLRPNTLILGFRSNWASIDPMKVDEYVTVIHDAFDLHYGVGILRVQEGFDCDMDNEDIPLDMTHDGGGDTDGEYDDDDEFNQSSTPERRDSSSSESMPHSSKGTSVEVSEMKILRDSDKGSGRTDKIDYEMLQTVNRFQRKQKKGTIDVWWLFDDGGLTLLIPHIISTKSQWRSCKLRVFTAATKTEQIDKEQRQMATLLSKFRIDCIDTIIIPDVAKKPRKENMEEFENNIRPWICTASESQEKFPWKTTTEEMTFLKDKTRRHIRLRELLLQHSTEAALIVMTLPMPKKTTCSSGLYMNWIDTLTRGMPPILLLRGNQTSVLTYYS